MKKAATTLSRHRHHIGFSALFIFLISCKSCCCLLHGFKYIFIHLTEVFCIHTSNYHTLHGKGTEYKNDTAGSMLCHNNPAAYTYEESVTLYSTPQKGGRAFDLPFQALPNSHMRGTPTEQHVKGEKWSESEKISVSVKGERLLIKILNRHKNQPRTINITF